MTITLTGLLLSPCLRSLLPLFRPSALPLQPKDRARTYIHHVWTDLGRDGGQEAGGQSRDDVTVTQADPDLIPSSLARPQMITSFKDIAAAMTRCVSIIEDYTRLSPSTLPLDSSTFGMMLHDGLQMPQGSGIDANALAAAAAAAGVPEQKPKKRRAKKEKKPKDPNAPKRPPSAYILFQNEIRDGIRNSNPEMTYKDVLNIVSGRWKDLSETERKVSRVFCVILMLAS